MRRTCKLTFLFLFALSCVSSAYAFENLDFEDSLETPVIEQIIANDQGVCLLIGDSWLKTESLQASENGIIVLVWGDWLPLAEAVAMGDCRLKSWKCSRCGRYNLEGVNACAYCGKPKKG